MSNLLLCETQDDLAIAMKEFLEIEGYSVRLESNGLKARDCLKEEYFDLILSEIALEGMNGLAVMQDYRARGGSAPFLILTRNKTSAELQYSYDVGADAYMAKPFTLSHLGSQIRALLRRPFLLDCPVLQNGEIRMVVATGAVTKGDQPVHLFPMEFKLLKFFLERPDQIFDARCLFDSVWRKDFSDGEGTVRTHIRTLRAKVDSENNPSIITTVRGMGYKAVSRTVAT